MDEVDEGEPNRDESPYDLELVALIVHSYRSLVGEPLVAGQQDLPSLARWLYADAPFCLLAHSAAADPRFLYANRATQRCFEYSWSELVGMPSRLSAPPAQRGERDQFLHDVEQHGFARGYRGLRVAKSGRRFWIEDVTLWNLIDAAGVRRGQAACYPRISPLEGAEPVA